VEQREVERIREEYAEQDFDVLDSMVRYQEWFCEDLRRAARNLALVVVVTRLQHWIDRFYRDITGSGKNPGQDSELVWYIKALNDNLGQGPVPAEFFQGLVTARDSVIHRNSSAQWSYKDRERKVPKCYCDGSSVEISEEHLKDAVAKAAEQVKWYDQQLESRRTRPSSPGARPGA
jgi:hypothetical protein